ncbi:MAG: YraN family protein [Luteolibacter sp.]
MTSADGKPRDRQWIGRFGEHCAVRHLQASGCRILARNFKAPRGGEVDIIARQGRLLMFVEVKTRRGEPKIRPLSAVNRAKQNLIERGANAWLKSLGTRKLPWRFDVIEVWLNEGEKPKLNHVRDAF